MDICGKVAIISLAVLPLSGCNISDVLNPKSEPVWDYVISPAPDVSGAEWARQAFPGVTSADRNSQLSAKFDKDVTACRERLDIHEPFGDSNNRDRLRNEEENLNVDPAAEPASRFTQLRDCATELAFGRSLTALRLQFRKDLRMCIAQYAPGKLEAFDHSGDYEFGDIPGKAIKDQKEPVATCLTLLRYRYRYNWASMAL